MLGKKQNNLHSGLLDCLQWISGSGTDLATSAFYLLECTVDTFVVCFSLCSWLVLVPTTPSSFRISRNSMIWRLKLSRLWTNTSHRLWSTSTSHRLWKQSLPAPPLSPPAWPTTRQQRRRRWRLQQWWRFQGPLALQAGSALRAHRYTAVQIRYFVCIFRRTVTNLSVRKPILGGVG